VWPQNAKGDNQNEPNAAGVVPATATILIAIAVAMLLIVLAGCTASPPYERSRHRWTGDLEHWRPG